MKKGKQTQQNKQQATQKAKPKAAPVKAAAVAFSQKQNFPKLSDNMKRRNIKNSELVQSINGTVSFNALRLQLNPGLASVFPWLSKTAANWQQYCFKRLEFRYVTRTSTSEKGSIILSPDYNPRDPPPTTEQQASNTMDAVEDVIWENLICRMDQQAMHPMGGRKIIRRSAVPGDLNLYDVGNLFICTVGEDNTEEIGKLWVDYDVDLFVPQNSPDTDSTSTSVSIYQEQAGDQVLLTGVNTKLSFDTAIVDGLAMGPVVAGAFTPPAGTFLVDVQIQISTSSGTGFTFQGSIDVGGTVMVTATTHGTTNGLNQIRFFYPISVDGATAVGIYCNVTDASGTILVKGTGTNVMFSAI